MWYIYTTEYYSAKKRETYPLRQHGMDLECIILSEVKLNRKREILYDLTYMWNLFKKLKHKLIEKRDQTYGYQRQRGGGTGDWRKVVKCTNSHLRDQEGQVM